MASNTKPHQRAFALTIALIFLVTTVATSVLVVMAIVNENKQNNSTNQSTADTDTTAADQTAATCAIDSVSGQAVLSAPEVFKPAGDVTALQTIDLEQGNGDVVKAGDCIIAKYYGTLATSGTVFDENFTKDTALQLQIGTGSVIKGWDEGIVGMKVGGTRRLVIPSDKAYGDQGSGTIPANSDLVFVVKVTEIKKP